MVTMCTGHHRREIYDHKELKIGAGCRLGWKAKIGLSCRPSHARPSTAWSVESGPAQAQAGPLHHASASTSKHRDLTWTMSGGCRHGGCRHSAAETMLCGHLDKCSRVPQSLRCVVSCRRFEASTGGFGAPVHLAG